MTPLDDLLASLHGLFATPQPTLALGIGRAVLGLVLAADGVRMLRDHALWYADDALRPPRAQLPAAVDLFAWAERLGASSRAVFHLMIVSALAFGAGLATPVSGAVLLLTLLGIPARNLLVVYGGDAFARTLVLLLVLSPCGHSISIDRWLEDGTLGFGQQAPPWGGRLVQLEVALLYLYNFLYKLPSAAWRRGTAMFDLLRNRNFARGDVPPWLQGRLVCTGLTWAALAAELGFGPGLLVPSTATACCLAAIAFHLAIARTIDVHRFSHVMVAGLVVCLPSELLRSLGLADATALAPGSLGDDAIPLMLALAYAAYAVLADIPGRRAGERSRPGAWLARIHWVRSWRLFTDSCRYQLEIQLVVVTRHEVMQWTWDRPEALLLGDDRDGPPNLPGHRFQRFKFALLDRHDARERLGARLRQALREAGIPARALSIDGLFFDVRDPRRARGPVALGIDLLTAVASAPGGGIDRDTATRLARATRCPATRAKLASLLETPPPAPSTHARRPGAADPA